MEYVRDNVGQLKTDVRELRKDVGDIRTDVATLKEAVKNLPTKVWVGVALGTMVAGVGVLVTILGRIGLLAPVSSLQF